MNINLTSTDHLSRGMSQAQENVGQISDHFVSNVRNVGSCTYYNQVLGAASLMTVNLALIYLSDKIFNIASHYFDLEKAAIPPIGKLCFKSSVLLIGVNGFNQLMNMQISQLYLVASVVITLALQAIWQKINQPKLSESEDFSEESDSPLLENHNQSHSEDSESVLDKEISDKEISEEQKPDVVATEEHMAEIESEEDDKLLNDSYLNERLTHFTEYY